MKKLKTGIITITIDGRVNVLTDSEYQKILHQSWWDKVTKKYNLK